MIEIRRKNGFTLIELMIVITVIAILASILIPRTGSFKTTVKNTGVKVNLDILSNYLSSRVLDDLDTSLLNPSDNNALEVNLKNDIKNKFSGSDSIINPLTNSADISTYNDLALEKDLSSNSIIIISNAVNYSARTFPGNNNGRIPASALFTQRAGGINASGAKGAVFIFIFSDGYYICDVDKDGNIESAIKIA